jgi:hypothetical protein
MELTTRLVQESRPTRLLESTPYAVGRRAKDGIVTLSDTAFQQDLDPDHSAGCTSLDYNPNTPMGRRFSI